MSCSVCETHRCCPEHCCDVRRTRACMCTRSFHRAAQWDECKCGDCEMCGGSLPAALSAEELAARAAAREVKAADDECRQVAAFLRLRERSGMEREDAVSQRCNEAWGMERERQQREAERRELEDAMQALHAHRDALQASVRRMEVHVSHLRANAEAARRDLELSQRQLRAVGRQADLCASMIGSSGDAATEAPKAAPAGFISPDRVRDAAAALTRRFFAIVDRFLPHRLADAVRSQLVDAHAASLLRGDLRGDEARDAVEPPAALESGPSRPRSRSPSPAVEGAASSPPLLRFRQGLLGGGATGRNTRYSLSHVRGDHFAWLQGDEPQLPALAALFAHLDHLVLRALPEAVAELRSTFVARGMSMAAVYPGGGARYVRHCDNPHGNGRLLTAIVYLNPGWTPDCGGQLRVYPDPLAAPTQAASTLLNARVAAAARSTEGDAAAPSAAAPEPPHEPCTVEPLHNRLLVFWSDARVPHEVLPAAAPRYAVTSWFVDLLELAGAQTADEQGVEGTEERERIEREIERLSAPR